MTAVNSPLEEEEEDEDDEDEDEEAEEFAVGELDDLGCMVMTMRYDQLR